jgi:hypothetical protein
MSEIPQTAEGFLFGVAEDLIAAHGNGLPLACTVTYSSNAPAYVCTWKGLPDSDTGIETPVNFSAYHYGVSTDAPLRLRILEIDIDDATVYIKPVTEGESKIPPGDSYMWWFINNVGRCVTAEQRYKPDQPGYPLTLCYQALARQHHQAQSHEADKRVAQ